MKRYWTRIAGLPAELKRRLRRRYQLELYPPVSFARPRLANYCLVADCQLNCEFCDLWTEEIYRQPPPAELTSHLPALLLLKRQGVVWLDLSLGEPFLYPFLLEFLASARELDFRIALTTNGLLLGDYLARLSGLIDRLRVKIFSPEEDENDRICGWPGAWREVLEISAQAKEKGLPVEWKFPLHRLSINYLPDMIALARQNQVRLNLWLWPGREPWGGFDQESLAYIRCCLPLSFVRVNNALIHLLRDREKGLKTARAEKLTRLCRPDKAVLTVGPDGRIISPCFYQPRQRMPAEAYFVGSDDRQDRAEPDRQRCLDCLAEEYLVPSLWQNRGKYLFWQAHSCLVDGLKGD